MTWWDEHIKNASWGHPESHPQRRWLADFILRGQRVLEVGYGTGKDYANLRVLDIEYRGYDFTRKFQKACQARWPDADFRLADATALPEPNDSWDVVFCRHLLEHVPDWQAALKELYRVTNGCLVIVSWRPLTDKPSYQTDEEVCTWVFNRADFMGELAKLGKVESVGIPRAAPIYVVWKNGTGNAT